MPEFIDDNDFGGYFEAFEHTAWRLETRRGYASDRASEKFHRWSESGVLPDDSHRPWCRNVRRQTAAGKRIERVRLVDTPLTPEQRYLLAGAKANNAAGEDIRTLRRDEADRLGLGSEDFWLFDACRALVLHFDKADEYLGAELVTDPARVVRFCRLRDAAWHFANPREALVTEAE
ncbi:DUF6879 family protein [Streptomyces sp. NPDC046887]|uniref:DUF6879 family protein n=1 Tax=Streptomyces sp. NPDC046887 TaxID=3155472 RepID=UPI0033D7B234